VDCANAKLALNSLIKSIAQCTFSESILFTDATDFDCPIRRVQIKKIRNTSDYSRFVLKNLHEHIRTRYVLIVQWDGYVIDGNKWDDDFFNYDYLGAKWHWHKDGKNIGNGGFSLRSKVLLDAISQPEFPFVDHFNEDEQICRVYRERLEREFAIKFPSEVIADKFSYERSPPDFPTFGFHGLFNLWRHVSDGEMAQLVGEFNPYVFNSVEYFELIIQYFRLRKFGPVRLLCSRAKDHLGEDEVLKKIFVVTKDLNFTKWFVSNFEKF
jgi:hypothetical protein